MRNQVARSITVALAGLLVAAACGGGAGGGATPTTAGSATAAALIPPTKPVEFVISTAPGGGSDIYARKMQAIQCYQSQFIAGRVTTAPTFMDDIDARARYFGWLIGVHYGEPFLSREEVGVRDLQQLS